LELSAGGLVVMTNFAKAESAYIHRSRVPVAMALASPTLPADGFRGHCLRAGYATSAAARDMPGYRHSAAHAPQFSADGGWRHPAS
jgi:hypothetical protein